MFADDPPGVDDTRDPGQAAEKDVDQELASAAGLHEYGDGRQQDSQDVKKHVSGRRFDHDGRL